LTEVPTSNDVYGGTVILMAVESLGRQHGIRVNSISPGLIETNQTREH
jgi:NAD(P)-dependent dehydrogenase (short-subunit alcohol dehydrogenase family)